MREREKREKREKHASFALIKKRRGNYSLLTTLGLLGLGVLPTLLVVRERLRGEQRCGPQARALAASVSLTIVVAVVVAGLFGVGLVVVVLLGGELVLLVLLLLGGLLVLLLEVFLVLFVLLVKVVLFLFLGGTLFFCE